MFDAFVEVCRHALDTQAVPDCHGTRPRLLVTLPQDSLREGVRAGGLNLGITGDGMERPPGVLRRLACDAQIIPLVLGTKSEVLDVGRTTRTIPPGIWHALIARDRHCTFPACTRPPVMCHAHHLHHWADGGPTALSNLALLCGHHHRTVHASPWQIRINPHHRQPEFSPPPRPGRTTPEWIRHRPRLE
jgi:hypothetical protein